MTIRSMDIIVGEDCPVIGMTLTDIEIIYNLQVVSITSNINDVVVRHEETFIQIQPKDRLEFRGGHEQVSRLSRDC